MDKVTKEVIALQNKIANKVLETQLENAFEDIDRLIAQKQNKL